LKYNRIQFQCLKKGWYDQETSEWVLLLKGAARLAFEDGHEVNMGPGVAWK
jgi:cupin 2 domain-containing protein